MGAGGSRLPPPQLTSTLSLQTRTLGFSMPCEPHPRREDQPDPAVSAEQRRPGCSGDQEGRRALGQLFLKVSLKSNLSTQELVCRLRALLCAHTGVSVLGIFPDISTTAPMASGCVLPADAAQRLLPATALRSTDPTARWHIITSGSEKCLLCCWLMENVFQAGTLSTGTPMGRVTAQSFPPGQCLSRAIDCT